MAVFDSSALVEITLSSRTVVRALLFDANAESFIITIPAACSLGLGGNGISNLAAVSQNFVLDGGDLAFSGNASAGANCVFTSKSSSSEPVGSVKFDDTSLAGGGIFMIEAGIFRGSARFSGSASADQASFVNVGASSPHQHGGVTQFFDDSSAGSANFTVLGATAAGVGGGGLVEFFDNSTAGTASFSAFGGTVGRARGGHVVFFGNSNAGSASFTNVGPLGNNTVGETDFHQNSSAANATFTVSHIGEVNFLDDSTAGNGTFFASQQGLIRFYDNSNAGQGTFTIFGRREGETTSGFAEFNDESNAGNSTLILTAGLPGDIVGGSMFLTDHASAGAAVIVLEGGTDGAPGGVIDFFASATAGSARLELLGNSKMDMSALGDDGSGTTGMTAGSVEGSGDFYLGSFNLTVGSNGLSSTFSGTLHDGGLFGGAGASLTQVGPGSLLLDGLNSYTGPTLVEGGILGGNGTVKGAVTVGGGSSQATLAPGSESANPGHFTTVEGLTFAANSVYDCQLDSDASSGDSVTANGVTIASGALCNLTDLGTSTLPVGTSFTIINNSSLGAIAGSFSNLPEGSFALVGTNRFSVTYHGGPRQNALMLTAVE